jgi:hypothetical protein
MSLSKQQIDAAGEFANATVAALKVGQGVHPPTLVAASARMAGIYLFRSFGLKISGVTPGKVVLSVEANEHAPKLIQITAEILLRIGVKIADAPLEMPSDSKSKPHSNFWSAMDLA